MLAGACFVDLDTSVASAKISCSESSNKFFQYSVETVDRDLVSYKHLLCHKHSWCQQLPLELLVMSVRSIAVHVQFVTAGHQQLMPFLPQAQADLVSSNTEWEQKVEGIMKQHQDTLSGLRNRLEQQDGDVRSASLSAEQYKAK